jgi:phage tail sheath gpL-like
MASRISLPTEIITSDKTPRTAVAFDKTSGAKQTSDTAREVLLVGQMLSTATVAANTPTMLLREDDGANYFGAGSMLDIACRAAFLANPFVKMSAVSVADAGVKATGTVTFAGTASISTIYRVRIAGVEYAVDVTLGDTATVIGASLAAKVNADKACPVTAANVTGTVTFTAKNGGTVGNGIKLMHSTTNGFDATTAQVTTTATLSGASLAAGTGTASLTTALAAATGKRYHVISILLDDATAGGAAKASTDSEGDAEHNHGEIYIQASNAVLATSTALALAQNAARGQLACISGSESWSVAIAAAYAAADSREETATRPRNTVVLNGILPPPVATRWTRTETRTLLDNGCTPLVVIPGEQVAILRAVVTQVKNASGDFDYSTMDVTKILGFDFFRDNIVLMFNTNYPKARWADSDPDGLLPSDVATPEKVKADLINVAREMESFGIVQNVDALKDQFLVEKNGTQCVFSVPAMIVDGMHEKLGKVVNILKLPLS